MNESKNAIQGRCCSVILTSGALLVVLVTTLCFGYVYLITAWIGDDAFITFRSIDNFVHGYGLRYNFDERVQAYTHPLWLLILCGLHLLTGEFYFTVLGLSFLLSFCALTFLLFPFAGHLPRALLLLLILLSSKAFVDYTSSGLENPLSYLLAALFYPWYVSADESKGWSRRSVFLGTLTLSVSYLIRPDLPLLFLAPCIHIVYRAKEERTRGFVGFAILGLTPAMIWTLFSLVYYGFVFPNTYYAKITSDIPFTVLFVQGLDYLSVCWSFDPVTLVIIALALGLSFISEKREIATVTVSIGLYLAYTLCIGGDFMSGRLLSVPFVIAAFLLVQDLEFQKNIWYLILILTLVLYNAVMPLAPINAGQCPGWPVGDSFGIADERGYYATATSLLSIGERKYTIDHSSAEEGKKLQQHTHEVVVRFSIGILGFYAGPKVIVIDHYGIADPLLARLPFPKSQADRFRPGHILRSLPEGYRESRLTDRNLIRDWRIHDYYDKIRIITRGTFFSAERWRAIFDMNVGRHRRFCPQNYPTSKP